MRRREFLSGSVAALVSTTLKARADQAADGLRRVAQAKNLYYGCAVGSSRLAQDSEFAAAVAREANILVAEGEMKRGVLQPAPDRYNFVGADYILRFAERNQQKVRGHNLVWHDSNPKWLPDALSNAKTVGEKEKLLTGYIDTVVRRYAGQLQSWDVVNEPIEFPDGRTDGMRSSSLWYQALGEDYISLAFHAAREADPNTPLYLNEFNIESVVRWNDARRVAVLKLIERMKSKGVPIDGFGIQGHIKPFRDRFDEGVFAKFLEELKGFGLQLMITEFDVADRWGRPGIAERDADVAAVTKSFIDVSLGCSAMVGVLTWGLSDKYSWLSSHPFYKWPDGQLVRGLPLDEKFVRKPMWYALADAFEGTRSR